MSQLTIGMTNKMEITVAKQHLASSLGSGGIDVLATPFMITLMEGAALYAVEDSLAAQKTSVGISLDVSHIAATPLGMKAYATAELIEINGRELTFRVEAYDEVECIGKGIHKRFVVDKQPFLEKVTAKTASQKKG